MYTVSLMEYNTTPTSDTPTPATDELYIYDPLTTDEGLMLTEPILSLEASCAGTFSCILPETNYGYGRIIRRRTRLVVRKDNKIIFMGRVNTEDRDLYLNQNIEAEGALAYLNDSLTEKKVFTASNDETNTTSSLFDILDYVFTNHNNKFPNEPWKRFNLIKTGSAYGNNDEYKAKFTGRNSYNIESSQISYYSINFYSSMETISELLSLANAVLKIEYNDVSEEWDVYVYDKYNLPKASQAVEFGKNLLDLIQTYNATDICSSVAPFGGDLIQESKEIGEAIAGYGINTRLDNGQEVPGNPAPTHGDDPDSRPVIAEWYVDTISVHSPDNWIYGRYNAYGLGYWVFGLYINNYNATKPDNEKLKQLYVSWRGFKFTTNAGEDAPEGYICDCAWRIYDSSGNTIAYHAFDATGFDEEINEVIDLTDGKYFGAHHIVISGWGGTIKPLLRRDAIVLEENDKVNITKCDVMGTESTDDLVHEENSFYLYSKSLVNSIGMVEKKLEYDIEDSHTPVSDWTLPYSANGHDDFDFDTTDDGPLGAAKEYPATALGYFVGNSGDEPDLELNKGHYDIIPFGDSSYKTLQYRLPSAGDPNRPRGVYISCRMHPFGIYEDTTHNKKYNINGMYVIFDDAWQVLSYKSTDEPEMGQGFTTMKDEYIDLTAAQNYGAKYIRVGCWGSAVTLKCVPTDESYPRNKLLAQAELYLTQSQWEEKVIEVTAVDLNMTSDEWERFDICTNVEVLSNFHGITGVYFPLTRLDIQLDMFENNTIKLGYDNDEYLSYQLSENLRLQSVAQTIEERRKNET